MKKLLSLVAIAFTFVACGSDTPEEVVKKCMNAVYKLDAKQLLACSYYKTDDEKDKASKIIMKGIERIEKIISSEKDFSYSIETNKISELENLAKIKLITTIKASGKMNKKEEVINLIKVDNKWYLEKLF